MANRKASTRFDCGDDGGPAYPIDCSGHSEHVARGFDGVTTWAMGMSRRDYFAAAALAGGLEQGVESNASEFSPPEIEIWWHPPSKVAERAYAIADAMLKESSR